MAKRAKANGKTKSVSVPVIALKVGSFTRSEALEVAADYAMLIARVANGKGCEFDAPPCEREIRSAASCAGYDLRNLLRALREHPEADRFELVPDGNGNAKGRQIHAAWLGIASLYDDGHEPEEGQVEASLAPIMAALRAGGAAA